MVETELAKKVVSYLQALNWEVYQEVVTNGPRADIVGVRHPLICIVECKTIFGLAIIEQADYWVSRGMANLVYIAIPAARHSRFGYKVCKDRKIGILTVSPFPEGYGGLVHDVEKPGLIRRTVEHHIGTYLKEQQKSNEAGSRGGHYTDFRGTVMTLTEIVKRNPGIALKKAIEEIKHHYRTDKTAVSSIRHWITSGVIKSISIDKGRLFPVEEK